MSIRIGADPSPIPIHYHRHPSNRLGADSANATKHCRSCNKTVNKEHSLHDCLRQQRQLRIDKTDKQLNIEQFIKRNNLTRRNLQPRITEEARERDISSLFSSIRSKLGLNYSPVVSIFNHPIIQKSCEPVKTKPINRRITPVSRQALEAYGYTWSPSS